MAKSIIAPDLAARLRNDLQKPLAAEYTFLDKIATLERAIEAVLQALEGAPK